MRLGGEDRVDVGLMEPFVLHALEEEADGHGASTAGSTMTETESPLVREGLRVGREDGPTVSHANHWLCTMMIT
jgi:hypothetical protein